VTIVLVFILSRAMSMGVTFSAMELREQGILDRGDEASRSGIPLRIEELTEIEGQYIAPQSDSESIFLKRVNITQMPHFDEAHQSVGPILEYTVLDVKMSFLYDTCKRQLFNNLTQAGRGDIPLEYRDRLEPCDADLWGAVEAYHVVNDGFDWETNHYLLCYPEHCVEIEFNWEVTEEQKTIVGEKLG